MKKRMLMLFLMVVLVVWVGHERTQLEPKEGYVLYFLTDQTQEHGPALTAQPWTPEQEALDPGVLLEALERGPTQEGLSSPFPRGVTVRSWQWDPETPGNLQVQMSEAYSGLSDISLTLADYSIVLTLAQLEEVGSVEIQAPAYFANYRSHQILLPEEAVLTDSFAH